MTAGPMTDHDRALWQAAQEDYDHALKIARKAWAAGNPVPTPEAIQAAAATVLIHITKLRQEERFHVKMPPVAATSSTTAAQSSVAVPPIPSACPACGGKVWDNRENKKNPKAPDWKCRDKTCLDDKGFTTAGWVDKKPKNGANTKPVPAGSLAEMPEALDGSDDDLPF
jgi:hypothetical protein